MFAMAILDKRVLERLKVFTYESMIGVSGKSSILIFKCSEIFAASAASCDLLCLSSNIRTPRTRFEPKALVESAATTALSIPPLMPTTTPSALAEFTVSRTNLEMDGISCRGMKVVRSRFSFKLAFLKVKIWLTKQFFGVISFVWGFREDRLFVTTIDTRVPWHSRFVRMPNLVKD